MILGAILAGSHDALVFLLLQASCLRQQGAQGQLCGPHPCWFRCNL